MTTTVYKASSYSSIVLSGETLDLIGAAVASGIVVDGGAILSAYFRGLTLAVMIT